MKQQILTLIESLLPEDGIYHSNENDGNDNYYFYTGLGCEIRITAVGNQVNFAFRTEVKYQNTQDVSVSFDFEEVKPLLSSIFNNLYEKRAQEYLIHRKTSFGAVSSDIDFINNYLQETDLTAQFEKKESQLNLQINSGDKNYSLRIGDLYHEKSKKKNILHICKIPLNIEEKGKERLFFEYMLPGWEIPAYKALESVISIDNGADDIYDFLEKINKVNPKMGAFFRVSILDQALPEKDKTKVNKI